MKEKTHTQIRSFGMSGYLVTDEIRQLEREYQIDLGHVGTVQSDQASDYYSQFEQSVRAEAASMSAHYELFYCLETSIRSLISENLEDSEGANWWSSGRVPKTIRDAVEKRGNREVDSGVTRRSERPIDYTTFGELSVVITKNWDIFNAVFSSERAVEKVMSSLNLLRGPIAHCCPLSEDEILRLNLAVKDWFRMMG